MSKNYLHTYTILIEGKGRVCLINELSDVHHKHKSYIEDHLAPALTRANCGWDDLKYICIQYPGSTDICPYMVLHVNHKPERWIPVDGNSDGCNLQVLGENIW